MHPGAYMRTFNRASRLCGPVADFMDVGVPDVGVVRRWAAGEQGGGWDEG